MRIPNSEHESRPWRIREIAQDFVLEDVWALPVQGGAEEFEALIGMMAFGDPATGESGLTRLLWQIRWQLGRLLGWDEAASALPIPGTKETSLTERLPNDLRDTVGDLNFERLPFTPVYRTESEFASEISNRTVHGVMHLSWVELGEGRYQGQMAVYVKPRGRLGEAYMALIKPFRYLIVYPALMRQMGRAWNARNTEGGRPPWPAATAH
ncbi:MAG TPA: DUF2867 domain-containing protein [Solirubrobacteraceae bacterium]|jgi:hypothetical protein|nr:DUF2867 domain-containing protein [Solirubrobacteraceae bacterium]